MNSQQLVSRIRRWFLDGSGKVLRSGAVRCTVDAVACVGARCRRLLALQSSVIVLLGAPLGVAAEPSTVNAQCLAVEQAFAANDLERLKTMTFDSNRWEALRNFRLAAIYIPLDEKRLARGAVRAGLAAVREGLGALDAVAPAERQPLETEFLLLGAMLDGQFLLIDRWRLFRNGFRGLRRLQRAERAAPNNNRALLVRGTAKVVAPWALGGSAEEAVQIFQRADLSSPLCAGGEWAQVDVLNWLGRAYAKLEQEKLARDAFQQALERSPNNHWVLLALSGEGYEWTDHGADETDERARGER